jgi:hypothetical protein
MTVLAWIFSLFLPVVAYVVICYSASELGNEVFDYIPGFARETPERLRGFVVLLNKDIIGGGDVASRRESRDQEVLSPLIWG